MSDEIKELLSRLKRCNEELYLVEIDCRCSKLLLDCITNLQEKNEDYKSRCEKMVDKIQQLIDDINNKTIIGLNNFLPKLEEIQDELADGVAETSV